MNPQLKDKTVGFCDYGNNIDIAMRLARESDGFGKVKYFCSWQSAYPKYDPYVIGYGINTVLPNFEQVHSVFDMMADVDIWVFPDLYMGDFQEWLRDNGHLVFGTGRAENLELHRDKMKIHLEELGLQVNKWQAIDGLDALRKHLQENNDLWVKTNMFRGAMESFHHDEYKLTKPRLDRFEHTLGIYKERQKFTVEAPVKDSIDFAIDMITADGKYPLKSLMGVEQKNCSYAGVFTDISKAPKGIIDIHDKLSKTLRQYQCRGFMSLESRITKDGTAYLLDPCFSDDTEIMTNAGWKLIKNICVGDSVATLSSDGKIEYQEPTDYIENDYEGEMVNMSNSIKTIDCLITPNHLVLRYDRNKNRLFKERADSLTDKGFIPRTGIWEGIGDEYFELPEYKKEWDFYGGNGDKHFVCTKEKHEVAKMIPMKDWAAFMAWYLSEGSIGNDWVVNISQTKNVSDIESVLKKLPFNYKYNGTDFRITSVQLVSYLRKYGLCNEKKLPEYIRNASAEVARVFLDNYLLGDGSVLDGRKKYFSSSKKMIDDIQELVFKCGSVGNIRVRNTKGTSTVGFKKNYIRNHDMYILEENQSRSDYWFETGCRKERYINNIKYSGKVYCVTTPNGTVYVRRNGKPFWSSNCMRAPQPPSSLYIEMYENFPQLVWDTARGDTPNIQSKYKYGVQLVIKSEFSTKEPQAVYFPDEIRDFVKIKNLCIQEGIYWYVSQEHEMAEIGGVVAFANTLKEAKKLCIERADMIKGDGIFIEREALDRADKDIEQLVKFGIKIF